MAKFKAGDRVRCLRESYLGTLHAGKGGVEYTVLKESHGTVWLVGFPDDPGSDADRFELVTPAPAASPIREVTKREIMTGTYGNVEIDEVGKTYVNIDSTSIYYAPDLRAAAKLFNEIADVLDENAKGAE